MSKNPAELCHSRFSQCPKNRYAPLHKASCGVHASITATIVGILFGFQQLATLRETPPRIAENLTK